MWYLFLAIVLALVVYSFYRYQMDTWQAACNVVVATYTFDQLTPDDKTSVRDKSIEILRRVGWPEDIDKEDHTAWYGIYALAMAELGILPGAFLDHWYLVANPLIAVGARHRYIVSVVKKLKRETGVEVTIHTMPNFPNGKLRG